MSVFVGKGQPEMDWPTRMKVAIGAAKGLSYLHEDCMYSSQLVLLHDNISPVSQRLLCSRSFVVCWVKLNRVNQADCSQNFLEEAILPVEPTYDENCMD